jgi:peptidoglycan/xylan/chitin deacetylase (PgdA/CDA1 family)
VLVLISFLVCHLLTCGLINGTLSLTFLPQGDGMNYMKKLLLSNLVLVLVIMPLLPALVVNAVGANLVSNSSVETAGPTTTSPKDWTANSWGNNSASFQYMNEGRTGSKSVRSTISAYSNGDAKWFFSPVAVNPGQSYTYSTYYKSSVSTEIIIQIRDINGSITYSWLKSAPRATAWTQVTATAVMPASAASASVFHVINKVGYLQTDDTFFGLTTATNPVAPTISISSPIANSVVGGTQILSANATSPNAAVAGVQFKVNGVNVGAEDTTAPYNYTWDTNTATNGNHTITATVRSTNGLSSTSAPVVVTVNNVVTPPPVDNENLILNPSVESVDPLNNAKPTSWLSNKWGTNTASFIYDQNGATGSRSVSVQMTSYVGGDAKWFFNPVAVTGGKTYLYRNTFKSNVPTRVVVASIDASGTYTYLEQPGAPVSTNWKQYQTSFVVPSNSVKVTVFHLIDKVGNLSVDDAIMQVSTPTPPTDEMSVPNGSVEIGATSPANWQSSSWGVNSPTFQYINNDGHTGTKSVRVNMSNYQSGDAKWFFDPVKTLTPGKQYRFNAWYKTNVIPHTVAMFVRADGTEQYFGMPAAQPNGSASWQQYSNTFSVPLDAVSVSVFMYINQNGYLQTDDYSITEYRPAGFNRPLLTMTFDDGHEDNVSTALPLLNQYGFKTTQCYATTFIEGNAQAINGVLAFKNSGHEICSHTVTHPFLTSLNATALNYELRHSKQYLESITGLPVFNFASPYGDYNANVNSVIDDYYQSHRTVDEGYNSKDNLDVYRLRVQNVLDTTSANQIKIWIEQAKADNTWLILVYHRVASNPGPYDSYTNVFTQHLATIQSSGITVKTYQDALTEVRSQL